MGDYLAIVSTVNKPRPVYQTKQGLINKKQRASILEGEMLNI